MRYLRLTYTLTGRQSPGELILDFIGQRWTRRTVLHAVVRQEFPDLFPEKMRGEEWGAERVQERFGITDLKYTFLQNGEPTQSPLPAVLKSPKRRVRLPSKSVPHR